MLTQDQLNEIFLSGYIAALEDALWAVRLSDNPIEALEEKLQKQLEKKNANH